LASSLWRDPTARFVVLAVLGFLPVVVETLRGTNEIYDFWEHAATVRAFMLHPFHPGNPLLAIRTPSAFFSPYLFGLALYGLATGTGPVHSLAIAGIIDYWLLAWGIWRFTRIFTTRPQAPFYALLFIWFLWGPSPWKYSGFFNYRSLSDVIAYPSTFATAIGMLLASLWPKILAPDRRTAIAYGALMAVGVALVMLTHPIAGDMTLAALLALAVTSETPRRSLVLLVAVVVAAGVLCVLWPYYNVVRLAGDQRAFDPSNAAMYSGWLLHTAPLLIAVGLVWYRTPTLHGRRVVVYLIPLAALFIYGAITGHYSQGRAISPLIIGVQIALADAAATWEKPVLARCHGRAALAIVGAMAVLGVAELANMRGGLKGSIPGSGSAPASYAAYKLAVGGLPATSTIMAPLNDGEEAAIPVYAGRLVGTHRALAFVNDQAARQQIVNEFYAAGATVAFEKAAIRRYRVRYIVVPTTPATLVQQMAPLGSVIRRGVLFDTIAVSRGT
jgi:hypothetical protein